MWVSVAGPFVTAAQQCCLSLFCDPKINSEFEFTVFSLRGGSELHLGVDDVQVTNVTIDFGATHVTVPPNATNDDTIEVRLACSNHPPDTLPAYVSRSHALVDPAHQVVVAFDSFTTWVGWGHCGIIQPTIDGSLTIDGNLTVVAEVCLKVFDEPDRPRALDHHVLMTVTGMGVTLSSFVMDYTVHEENAIIRKVWCLQTLRWLWLRFGGSIHRKEWRAPGMCVCVVFLDASAFSC